MGADRDATESVTAGEAVRRPVYDSYARLSRVPETGELEKIETQHADNHKVIDRLGGVLGLDLDDGMSAWRKGAKRPDWERLLERLESGESDGVCVWHVDRLFRQPKDLERLIELGDSGYQVASAHGARDLADPNDRFILRIEVAHAARSSDDTQRRTKRRFDVLRRKGVPHPGARSFGFPGWERRAPGTTPKRGDRVEVPAEQVAAERQAIADAVAPLLAGATDSTKLARKWNAAGLRTATGKTFTGPTVRSVLLRPRNAGLVEHNGDVVAKIEGDDDPIIDPDDFERLRTLFAGRRRGRVVGEKYVGSGIIRCGRCDTPLSGRPHNGVYRDTEEKRRQYACTTQRRGCGKVAADARKIDVELRKFVTRRLSDRRFAAAISEAYAKVGDRLAELERLITECEQTQEALSERLGRREMKPAAFDRANRPLLADLATFNAERTALLGGRPDGPVQVRSAEEIGAEWDAGTITHQRGMLRRAVGDWTLVLNPAAPGGKKVFDHKRLRPIEPKYRPELAVHPL